MEAGGVQPRKRGRKRKHPLAEQPEGVGDRGLVGRQVRKELKVTVAGDRGLIGRQVQKEFKGIGVFAGTIVRVWREGFYRVNYEDGDKEDLDYDEVMEILVGKEGDEEEKRGPAEKKGPAPMAGGPERATWAVSATRRKTEEGGDRVGESSGVSKLSSESDSGVDDADSCTASREPEVPMIEPPLLPSPSGSIGVPEDSLGNLFSVYNFLRSFSHHLFLSPFGLGEFIGALNCTSQNSLLESVHVSLLRALRRHLEALSHDANYVELSALALKCLQYMDWSLIDTLTWPVFVVEYLHIKGLTKGKDWKEFHEHVLKREYYSLSVPIKLRVLQILCDDLLDNEELRTEINMRESEDEGVDSGDNAIVTPQTAPKRVHPRYSKTSACKNLETVDNIDEPSDSKPSFNHNSVDSNKLMELEANASDEVDDGNSDECRLCGMDGMLLCCDGCPSVYHSRCLGLTKASLPEGLWFCPECVVNKMGQVCSRIGRGLNGAEVFGTDPYGRVFMGTCSYILVLDSLVDVEPIYQLYNHDDVLELLRALSSPEHMQLYSEICKGILQYCEISEDAISLHPGGTKRERLFGNDGIEPDSVNMNGVDTISKTSFINENPKALNSFKQESCTINVENRTASCQENVQENHKPLCSIKQELDLCYGEPENGGTPSCQENVYINEVKLEDQKLNSFDGDCPSEQKECVQFCPQNTQVVSDQLGLLPNSRSKDKPGADSTVSSVSQSLPTDPSYFNHQSSGERSVELEFATSSSRDIDRSGRGDADSTNTILCMKNGILSKSLENRQYHHPDRSKGDFLHIRSFKPCGYINQYILGDVAASAAANLAILASESCKASETQMPANRRKMASGNISIHMKAFSVAALHFQWPGAERRLMDAPRERCGWCIACKSAMTIKKGCLLNLTATNALKVGPRAVSNLPNRSTKNGGSMKNSEVPIPAIAAYILDMEESLHGFIVGPLLLYRRQWRKQVEQASTCQSLKHLLFELEANINLLALSGSWVKPVDDCLVNFSTAQFGNCNVGSAQKRGPTTRRRKHSATSSIAELGSRDFRWWRRGKISKVVFQTGVLPRSIVKKAGRQGGCKKISGIHYAESSEIPRRSRQLAWRAAVKMSKNTSQLAFQVRCLDAHVRWGDIVHPELTSQDVKGVDFETTSTFRNAIICSKKVIDGKIRYALAFENQKHLPSRVMKNVLEEEQSKDGKKFYWFSESYIPLYLIKDFECKVEKHTSMQLKRSSIHLSRTPKRLPRTWGRDIFSYLEHRDDAVSCASCQQDVLLRDVVKCGICQGYCHKGCTFPSTAESYDDLEFLRLCKQCYLDQSLTPTQNINNPSLQEQCEISSSSKSLQLSLRENAAIPVEKKPAKRKKGSKLSYGLIWGKNFEPEYAKYFRDNHILPASLTGKEPLFQPTCALCKQSYTSTLMYIHCETCENWYHADALELKADQVLKLVGFRCCKCRRKPSPVCPYTSEEKKFQLIMKKRSAKKGSKNSLASTSDLQLNMEEQFPSTSESELNIEYVATEDDDPLLFCLKNVELITEQMPETNAKADMAPVFNQNLQKLPVGRHVKYEYDAEGFSVYTVDDDVSQNIQKLPVRRNGKLENDSEGFSEYIANVDAENQGADFADFNEEAPSHQPEWEFSSKEVPDFEEGSAEDMEYEPQTYFSFTELLATGDDRMEEFFGAPMNVPGNGNNSSSQDDMGQTVLAANSASTYEMGMVNGLQEPTAEPSAVSVSCKICDQSCPELFCEVCHIRIHGHCSPWEEPSSSDHGWQCGNCRAWR